MARSLKPARALHARARAGAVLALLSWIVLAALMAGCGSSDNGVASKPGTEVLAAAKKAAEGASSVRVAGRNSVGLASLAIDLHLAAGGGRGHFSFGKLDYEVIRIGETVYVKGAPMFYKSLGATQSVPKGTWLKAPANRGPIAQLTAIVDLRGELNRLLSTPGSVTKGAMTKLNGQKVIELKEQTKVYKGVLYIATTGKPYPLLFVKSGGRERGRLAFTGWDKGLSLSAPSPAVDVSTRKD